MYEFLEAEGIGYSIRLPANTVLQDRIGYLLKRPVGRSAHEVRRYYVSFSYQAQSWKKPRRVVAKVKWHPGELYPRRLYRYQPGAVCRARGRLLHRRGTAEQWIREGKGAIKWTQLSCRTFAANVARLHLHALPSNFRQFHADLAPPKAAEAGSTATAAHMGGQVKGVVSK
jgi:hypothetical protein